MYLIMQGNRMCTTVFLAMFILKFTECNDIEKYSFLMPNVRPYIPELYLCSPIKVDNNNTYYIVGFEPNATMDTAHHIILYGCGKPGSIKSVWNCGEMSQSEDMTVASPCDSDSEIIYAWARDAPAFILPDGVGFKIGKHSKLKYLVLQVHYAHIDQFDDGSTDDSGIILHFTKQPLTKLAGIYILGTGGSIPPHSVEYMEASCLISENKTIYPFAYRVHTHSLGKIVSGYVIKNNKWIELGKQNPLTPQMFYKVIYNGRGERGSINLGDRLATRCTMESKRNRWTYVGTTNNDEMCNFYLMYYIENSEPLESKFCFSMGPPTYYWYKDGLLNIPDQEASTL